MVEDRIRMDATTTTASPVTPELLLLAPSARRRCALLRRGADCLRRLGLVPGAGQADRVSALGRGRGRRAREARGRLAAALLARRLAARVRLRPRTRGAPSLRVDDRELGEIPGSVEDIHWAPDGAGCSCSQPISGPTGPARTRRPRSRRPGAEAQDPKVFRPAKFWRRLWLVDAGTGDTRDVTPEGVNVFELGWAGGKVAAVCTDEPSESAWYDAWLGLIDLEARSVERVHTPNGSCRHRGSLAAGRVAWVEGFASDRAVFTGTVRVLGAGDVAPELDATWIAFADEETLWVAGWRGAGSISGRSRSTARRTSSSPGTSRSGCASRRRSPPSADGSRFAAVRETARRCRARWCSRQAAMRLPRHVAQRRDRAEAASAGLAFVPLGVVRRARDRRPPRGSARPRRRALAARRLRPRWSHGLLVVELAPASGSR